MTRYTSFHEFITYFSYSGHPPLWYLIHLPFSRLLELPVETQKVFPVIFTRAFAWPLLFKSPLPLCLTIPLLFSVHLVYQHGVIARGCLSAVRYDILHRHSGGKAAAEYIKNIQQNFTH